MFCTKCGKMIPDDSKFCSFCGNVVSGAHAPTSASQPQSGSVYLRPPHPMTPPQPTPGYRPPVRPMTPPPAAPTYQPPVRPMTPPPAAPTYQPPVAPVTPPPAASTYQPPVTPVTPPPGAPTYQPPVQPAPAAEPVKEEPVVASAPVATEPVVAEPVVNKMPEPPVVHINVSENTENIMVNKSEPVPFEAKPEPATEAPKPAMEPEVNKTEDFINQEATVTEMYIPADALTNEENTVALDNAENASAPINEEKKPVFYTEPNVVSCEDEAKKPIVKTILKITCAVLAVIFAISALLLGSIRMALTEENVLGVVDGANIGSIIDQNGGDLGEFCIDRISDEDMKKLFEQKPFKDYFKKAANEYVAYILGGEKGESLSGKSFSELIEKNPGIVRIATGYEFRSFEYELVEARLNRVEEISEIYECDETQALRFVLSPYTLIGLIVLALLCLAGVVIFSNDKRKAIRLVGVIVAGIAILTFSLIFVVKLCVAISVYGELAAVLDGVINNIILPACITCGGTLLVGILIFVISLIGRKKELV